MLYTVYLKGHKWSLLFHRDSGLLKTSHGQGGFKTSGGPGNLRKDKPWAPKQNLSQDQNEAPTMAEALDPAGPRLKMSLNLVYCNTIVR
ncbi:hypothetical protein TNCV_4880771 [Trichonephila clavipes]|nr:hypothetical protein TNCV_4880771 [Trichonephila clavipes]